MRVPKAYQINSSDKAQTRVKHLIHFFVVQWRKFTFKHSPHSFCTISFASKIALVSIWLDWHFLSIETTEFVTNIPSPSLGHFHFVILVTLIKLKSMKILSFFLYFEFPFLKQTELLSVYWSSSFISSLIMNWMDLQVTVK